MDIKIGSYTVVSSEEELSIVIDAYSKAGFAPYMSKEDSLEFFREHSDIKVILLYAVDHEGDGLMNAIVDKDIEDYVQGILLESDSSYKPNEIKLSELV